MSTYEACVWESPIRQFILTLGVDILFFLKKKVDLGAEHQASDFEKKWYYLICLALVSSQCEIPSCKPRLSWHFPLPFSRKSSCWLPFSRALDRARAENRMIKSWSKPLLLLCDFPNTILCHSDAPPAPGINHLLTEGEWKAISFIGAFPPWNSIAV